MNRTNASIIGGGLLLLGSLQSQFGPDQHPEITTLQAPASTTSFQPISNSALPRNEDGPWAAICRYFAVVDPEDDQTGTTKVKNKGVKNGNKEASAGSKNPGFPRSQTAPERGTRGGQSFLEFRELSTEMTQKGTIVKRTVKEVASEHLLGDVDNCVSRENRARYAFDFLIATVPDPINSHLAVDYDRSLASIQAAAELSGYAFDRYWLPWDDIYLQHQTDPEKSRSFDRQRRLREEQPGLFIFHGVDQEKDSRTLFVFVVGETPSYGINKIAFAKAVLYIRQLRRVSAEKDDGELRIAGPSLSASFNSLRLALQSLPEADSVRVVSGSAANESAIRSFETSTRRCVSRLGQTNTYLEPQILRTLDQLFPKKQHFAFLYESSSVYGTGPHESLSVCRAEPPIDQQSVDAEPDPSNRLDRLKFPRGIAPLRNAYQREQETLQVDTKQKRRPFTSLPMSLRESENNEQENVPTLSRDQTPLSEEATLREITRTLKEHRVKAAVIFATDALDTAFLMRYLRTAYPDLTIVLPAADLLLLSHPDSPEFTGTLVFSNYPLFSSDRISLQEPTSAAAIFATDTLDSAFLMLYLRTVYRNMTMPSADLLFFSHPDNSESAGTLMFSNYPLFNSDKTNLHSNTASASKFASSGSEGMFLAVLSTLNPSYSIRRDFWMGVLGKNGYWPLRRISVQDVNLHPGAKVSKTEPTYTSYEPGSQPSYWRWLTLLVATCSLAFFAAVLLPNLTTKLHEKWWLEYFVIEDSEAISEYSAERAFFLLTASLLVEFIVLLVILPTSPHRNFGIAFYAFDLALGIVAIGTALASVSKRSRLFLSLSILAILLFVLAAAVWYSHVFATHSMSRAVDAAAFAERSLALTSGVSPLLPLFLLAVGLLFWSLVNLRRLTYVQNREPGMPVVGFDDVVQTGFKNLYERIEYSLSKTFFFTSRPVFSLFLLILVVCFFVFNPFGITSLEGLPYNYMFALGCLLLWTAVFAALFRFVYVWMNLRQLLRRLERLPLRYAFSRIPTTFSWSPIWQWWGGTKRSYLVHTRSLEYLRSLSYSSAEVGESLKIVLEHENSGQRIQQQETLNLAIVFNEAATHYAELLSQFWKHGGAESNAAECYRRRRDLPNASEATELQLRMLAAEFVALRFVGQIRYIGLQMRNLLTLIAIGFMLGLLSLKIYPFQPRQSISWAMTVVFVVFSGAIIYVFAQMDRDAILSRISNTRTGKIDAEFFWHVAAFGALPLFTFIATQFPSVSNFLFSWIQPGLQSVR